MRHGILCAYCHYGFASWGKLVKDQGTYQQRVLRPGQLKIISKAFDDAWEQIAPTVSGRPLAVEAARLRLANVILGLAKNGCLDGERLREEAVKIVFASPSKL